MVRLKFAYKLHEVMCLVSGHEHSVSSSAVGSASMAKWLRRLSQVLSSASVFM